MGNVKQRPGHYLGLNSFPLRSLTHSIGINYQLITSIVIFHVRWFISWISSLLFGEFSNGVDFFTWNEPAGRNWQGQISRQTPKQSGYETRDTGRTAYLRSFPMSLDRVLIQFFRSKYISLKTLRLHYKMSA